MRPKERVLAALNHEEPDRVPTGEKAVDGKLAERILGHPTLYNAGWRELEGERPSEPYGWSDGGRVIAWFVAMSSAEWLGCAGVRRGGTACDRRGRGVQ